MNRMGKTVVATLAMFTVVAGAAGCQKEGPAEQAGKAVDNAMDKTGQQVEKAGDKIQDAAKDATK